MPFLTLFRQEHKMELNQLLYSAGHAVMPMEPEPEAVAAGLRVCGLTFPEARERRRGRPRLRRLRSRAERNAAAARANRVMVARGALARGTTAPAVTELSNLTDEEMFWANFLGQLLRFGGFLQTKKPENHK